MLKLTEIRMPGCCEYDYPPEGPVLGIFCVELPKKKSAE